MVLPERVPSKERSMYSLPETVQLNKRCCYFLYYGIVLKYNLVLLKGIQLLLIFGKVISLSDHNHFLFFVYVK